MTSYQYVNNNPIMFTDPTGMSAEGGGDGWWNKLKEGDRSLFVGNSDPRPNAQYAEDGSEILNEIVINTKRKNWFQRNFSKDKLKRAVSRAAENTGFNHAVTESINIHNSINKTGAFRIWGIGTEGMGRNDIEIHGTIKDINVTDLPRPGAGGASPSEPITKLVQYLNGVFGLFTNEKTEEIIKENIDTIWLRVPIRPGSRYKNKSYKIKNEKKYEKKNN